MNDSKILSKLPAVLDWSAAIWSGFISGTVSLFVSIVLPWIIINDPLLIVRLMASILLGPGVISPQNDLVPGVYVVAILTHFSLSFAFTFIIAIIFHRWGMVVAFIGGAIMGFVIYILNFYLFSLVFPWLLPYGNWMLMLSNIVFGALAGTLYEMLEDGRINDEPFFPKRTSIIPQASANTNHESTK